MKNATPKSKTIDKNRKDRIEKLSKINKEDLKKALILFNQLNTSGIQAHKIEENKIIGLKNEDITWALHAINPIYVEENNKIPNAKYMEEYEEILDETGKLKKLKIILYGDIVNKPVFFLTGFNEKSERTFMAGPRLDDAIDEIDEVLNTKNRYLTLKQDIFQYEGKNLKLKPGILYNSIKCVYNHFSGKNGTIKLVDLYDLLKQIKGFSRKKNTDLYLIVRQNLTSRAMGFGKKIGKDAFDKHRVFEMKNGELFFTNEKVSD